MIFRRLLKPAAPASVPEPVAVPLFTQETDTIAAQIDILARTLWGEARGESLQGQEAVANVIMNRLALARKRGTFWWGNTIESICRKPYQFSCWNSNDPNYPKIMQVTLADPVFAQCQRIARRAIRGLLADHTFGADHYHALSVSPSWARSDAITATIGNHVFYKLEA